MDAHLFVIEFLQFGYIVQNALYNFAFGRSWNPFAFLWFGDLSFDDASAGIQAFGFEVVDDSS